VAQSSPRKEAYVKGPLLVILSYQLIPLIDSKPYLRSLSRDNFKATYSVVDGLSSLSRPEPSMKVSRSLYLPDESLIAGRDIGIDPLHFKADFAPFLGLQPETCDE
jgi:hypothetical protein